MRNVISGSLNGNAYQFEEGAFTAIKAWLDAAAATSRGTADQQELLSDLEQSIADKCDAHLGKHKNVISDADAAQILREMGPVQSADASQAEAAGAATESAAAAGRRPHEAQRGRRLYRIPAQGMLGGVCAGLAAYFGVDVVWVRVVYILLVFTTGIWLCVWIAQLIITPKALTDEEIAGAHGTREAFGR